MNSGFSSVIDAIFGKKDFDSVSLEEMYEVVQEFPSFNAAHLLLSKKLILDNDASFEKESMRTSLYFNNPLWLQSILEESDRTFQDPVTNTSPDPLYLREENVTADLVSLSADKPEEQDVPVIEFNSGTPVVPSETGSVTSFDELMSKYHIEIPEPLLESTENIQDEKTDLVP